MNYPIKIVCCVVDVHNVTLYKDDGETIVIPQGDVRLKDLVAKMVPAFEPQGPQFYMLTEDDMSDKNSFAETEKKMGGVARFFKMVKTKAKELLDKFAEPIMPVVMGSTAKAEEPVKQPVPAVEEMKQDDVPTLTPEEQRPLTKNAAAVAEIMANAMPASTKGFSNEDAQGEEETTVIAVLDDNTIIPGCEALAQQALAVSSGVSSGDAMANFLSRAGSIKRGHSVEDLLKFIQKGELPLADDGSVLVYKLLNSTDEEGVFVDCHSGNVKQRVGSFVHMAEHMVDPNRNQDCSNGLHVARRDYLRSFSGDVCVLAKLAPEDVIAVPQYDARKLRAKGYHIIALLSDSDRKRVKNNQPMEDQILLGNAVAGNHAPIVEYVEITGAKGGGLKITPAGKVAAEAAPLNSNLKSSSLDHLNTGDSPAAKVDARALALSQAAPVQEEQKFHAPPAQMQVAGEPVAEATPVPPPVPAEKPVQKLNERDLLLKAWSEASTKSETLEAAKGIVAYKKAKKKSWTALGIATNVWTKASELVEAEAVGAKNPVTKADIPAPKLSPVAAAVLGAAKPSVGKKEAKTKSSKSSIAAQPDLTTKPKKPRTTVKVRTQGDKTVVVAKAAPGVDLRDVIGKVATKTTTTKTKAPVVKPVKEAKMTQAEQMAKLVEIYNRNPDKQNAKEIVAFKQKAKKGWDVLGVTDTKFIKKITERAKL